MTEADIKKAVLDAYSDFALFDPSWNVQVSPEDNTVYIEVSHDLPDGLIQAIRETWIQKRASVGLSDWGLSLAERY